MSNLGLYTAAVLIWGSTWLVIKFQLGVVSPVVSVAWRFALAAADAAGLLLRSGADRCASARAITCGLRCKGY